MERTFLPALAAALLFSSLATAPAFAGEDTANMTVRVGGLNLKSESGSLAAFNRIKSGARAFCGGSEGTVSINTRISIRQCQNQMTYLAVMKLDAPLVTSLYTSSGRKPWSLMARR